MTVSTEILAPTFVLYENGQKVQDKTLLASVVRIAVDERLDQATVCMVELADRGLAISGGEHFAVGSELKVELGYVGATDVLFDGEITSWRESFPRRGPPTLVLFGLDRFHRLRRERKSKTYAKMKDADIARQVLGDHNLQVTADATDVAHDYVIQSNQSDADFLLARAALNGFELAIDGKKATFRKPKLDDAAAVTLKWQEDLTSFTAAISVANAHAEVQAKAFDMKQKAPVSASVAAGSESSSMGGLKTGNQVLSSGMDATEPTVDPFRPLLSPEEATLLAQATMDRDSKKFVTGEGRVPGNTKIHRGVVIALDGIGEHLSGNYYCSAALHTLIPRFGYSTVFHVYRTSVLAPKTAPPVQAQPGQPPGQPTPPSGPVQFFVQNQFGEPVDGLDYVLTCPDGEKKTGTIPANGIVREENAKPGVYKLALTGVGIPELELDATAGDDDADKETYELYLNLVANGGAPLARQTVQIVDPDTGRKIGKPVTTAGDGSLRVGVPRKKDYEVWIVEDDATEADAPPMPVPTPHLPVGVLGARFLDVMGAPVANESVSIQGVDTTLEATTDADGRIELGVDPGPYDLTIKGETFTASTVQGDDAANHEDPFTFVVGVESFELFVNLLDAGGAPLARQTVQVIDPDTEEPVGDPAVTDDDGNLRVTVPEKKEYEVQIVDDDAFTDAPPMPDPAPHLPAAVLAARFLDGLGAPIAGESVSIQGTGGSLQATTDPDGRIELAADPGPYDLTIKSQTFTASTVQGDDAANHEDPFCFVVGGDDLPASDAPAADAGSNDDGMASPDDAPPPADPGPSDDGSAPPFDPGAAPDDAAP